MTVADPITHEKPPIRGLALIAAPLLGVVLFVAAALLIVAAYLAAHHNLSSAGVHTIVPLLRGNLLLNLFVGGLFYLAFLASAWLCLPKSGPASLASYFPPIGWRMVVIAVLSAFAAAVLIGTGLSYLQTHHFIDFHTTPGEEMLVTHDPLSLICVLIFGAIIAPLVEEIYFRGLLLRWLRKRLGLIAAALINAAFFALLHGRFLTHPGLEGLAVTAALMIPGLVLVAIAVRANSLRASFITHATYNALLLIGAAYGS
jgi:hypothetical protein